MGSFYSWRAAIRLCEWIWGIFKARCYKAIVDGLFVHYHCTFLAWLWENRPCRHAERVSKSYRRSNFRHTPVYTDKTIPSVTRPSANPRRMMSNTEIWYQPALRCWTISFEILFFFELSILSSLGPSFLWRTSTRFVGLYRYTHETFEICLVLISAYIVIFKHAVHVHWIRGEGKSIFWYLPTFIFGVIVPLLLVWEEDTTSVMWDNCSQSLENITPHLHLLQQPSRISNVFFFARR